MFENKTEQEARQEILLLVHEYCEKYHNIDKGFKKKLCYITTAVCRSQNKPDNCYELTALREYRDNYLMNSNLGRELVDEYYNIAPGLVMMIDMQQEAEKIYQNIYDKYLPPSEIRVVICHFYTSKQYFNIKKEN